MRGLASTICMRRTAAASPNPELTENAQGLDGVVLPFLLTTLSTSTASWKRL